MADGKPCKDCMGDARLRWLKQPRPAPHPGPRCATHHRAVVKARRAVAHDNRVQRVYGLPPGEYERLLMWQGGVCAICRRANGRTRRLSVDHDHGCCDGPTSCGECVRGALCRPCNDMLGHARDNPKFFDRAGAYLGYPPYRQMKDEASDEREVQQQPPVG